jgi:hypothetical protein
VDRRNAFRSMMQLFLLVRVCTSPQLPPGLTSHPSAGVLCVWDTVWWQESSSCLSPSPWESCLNEKGISWNSLISFFFFFFFFLRYWGLNSGPLP